MRVVFMGTPEIAAHCLSCILDDGQEVAAVYTKPDTKKNRGMKTSASPVKALAEERGIPVLQPLTFRTPEAAAQLAALAPDIVCVVAYGKILPSEILAVPPFGCVNIHASLLPKYRGAAPIARSILSGDRVTGVTAMYLSEGMDEGDMISSVQVPIEDSDTTLTLTDKLAEAGGALLTDTLHAIASGTARRTPQNPSEATYAPMLEKSMAPIDWNRSPREISCHVRGLIPWPVATMQLGGVTLRVFSCREVPGQTELPPGKVAGVTKEGLLMAAGGGKILVTEVQAPGGKRMSTAAYLRGHPLAEDV